MQMNASINKYLNAILKDFSQLGPLAFMPVSLGKQEC